jgi:hypothetical protein
MTAILTAVDSQNQIKPNFRIKKVSLKSGLAKGRVCAFHSTKRDTKFVIQRRIRLAGLRIWLKKRSFSSMVAVQEYLNNK